MARRSFLFVLFAFLLSVAVRAPQLGRPLSAHHEYCTAVALIILHNWYADGFLAHQGNPVISFTDPADRIPEGYTTNPAVHDGVMYYFSHPPLAYDLPYAMFKAVGRPPDALGLQVFNLFFHFIAALCLLLALQEAVPGDPSAPVLAAMLYLFMPAPLWFHGNVYMSDMFVQVPWLMHLVVAMRLFHRKDVHDGRLSILFTTTLFLAVYTSWLGVFATVTGVGMALHSWRRDLDRRWLILAGSATVVAILALALTAWRYTRIIDLSALLAYFQGRFAERGSFGVEAGIPAHLLRLITNYRLGYLPLFLLLGALSIRRIAGRRGRSDASGVALGTFIVLSGAPVLMDHAFLLQYADHDFAVLKAGPLLCGIAAIGLRPLRMPWRGVSVAAVCMAGVLYFYRINPLPGSDAGRYALEKELGTTIASTADPQEMVFTLGFTPEPQVQWYAQRTLFRVDTMGRCNELMRAQGSTRGIVFQYRDPALTATRITAP
ncbi:MAG: hypothetical protein R2815_11230 [Flavobacteriales bacterium]